MNETNELTHLSNRGAAKMVDVHAKHAGIRTADAEAWIEVGSAIAEQLRTRGGIAKGNVLETARIAAVMAAKRTADLIPLCHPLVLDAVDVEADLIESRIHIRTHVACEGKTGVEMEALTAASIAALTVYDMVKSASKAVEIGPIRLLEKTGGKSGHWRREGANHGTC